MRRYIKYKYVLPSFILLEIPGASALFSYSRIDDEIVKIRGLMGLIYGIMAYILYRIGLWSNPLLSSIVWMLSVIVYIGTVIFVVKKLGANDWFHGFFRGIVTYYCTWLLVLFILYDLIG